MTNRLLFSIALLMLACACTSRKNVPVRVGVQNTADHPVAVFWTADQCNEADVAQAIAGICHRESLAPHQSAEFSFPAGYANDRISIHRDHEQCTLPDDRNDVSMIGVDDGDFVLTTGCGLDKGLPPNLRSANPAQATGSTSR